MSSGGLDRYSVGQPLTPPGDERGRKAHCDVQNCPRSGMSYAVSVFVPTGSRVHIIFSNNIDGHMYRRIQYIIRNAYTTIYYFYMKWVYNSID